MPVQSNINRSVGSKSLPASMLSKALQAAVEFSGFGPAHPESKILPSPIHRVKSSLIIGIASFKGGSGKTTLAVNLSVGFGKSSKDILLIDADVGQGSATRWGGVRKKRDLATPTSVTVQLVSEALLVKTLRSARSLGWPVTVVDLPGSSRPSVTEAFKSCDVVLIACRPTAVDVRSAKATMKALKSLHVAAAYILTQAPSALERVERFRELLATDGLVLPTHLASRVVYQDSCARGLSVLECNDKFAKLEMQNLISNIKTFTTSRKT
jgi:chromosome partitioning protein